MVAAGVVSLLCFIPLLIQSERTSTSAFDVSSANVLKRTTCTSTSIWNSSFWYKRRTLLGPCQSQAATGMTKGHDSASGGDLEFLVTVRDAVVDAGGDEAWQESMQVLSHLFDTHDAEQCLADAFGWKAWAHAPERTKKFHRPKVPDATKLREALDWLRDGPLALKDEQVQMAILKSPKTYLDAPNVSYGKALGTAPRKYRENLQELIRLDPAVLEVTYNCDGEGCASECGRCWVSYENRLPPTMSSQSSNTD